MAGDVGHMVNFTRGELVQDVIEARFAELVRDGNLLMSQIGGSPIGDGSDDYYVPQDKLKEYAAWLSSVANLLGIVSPPGSHYTARIDALLAHENMQHGIVSHVVRQICGVLGAAHRDWKAGLLRKIEFIVAASTFDDFLDQAEDYYSAGKKTEASVLAGAVLEDAVKKVAIKNEMDPTGMTLDPIIDSLVKAGVLTPVKAKRWKSFAGVRNKALHAEWDQFDLDDVGAQIVGVREILADYL